MAAGGSLSLGAIVGIVAGALVILALGAYLISTNINKRRAKSRASLKKAEAAMKMSSRENLVKRNTEYGHFTSRPHSPSPSYVLAPSTNVVNWGDSKSSIHSASSSVLELPRSRNGSISSLPAFPKAVMVKSSPLRLNPSSASIGGRISTTGSVGGSYMPPLPSHRSFGSFANPQASGGWVSPLDVHFSRPSTPQAAATSRPQSYLPRLQVPEEIGKNALVVPTPTDSVAAAKSEAASIVSSNATSVPEPQLDKPFTFDFNSKQSAIASSNAAPVSETLQDKPSSSNFNFNFFDNEAPQPPSRGARRSMRSIFPATNDDERPVSRRSAKTFDMNQGTFPLPPVPQSYFGPPSPSLDPSTYGDKAVIRASIVSKRSVSIYVREDAPPTPSLDSNFPQIQIQAQTHIRTHSRAASSVYSTTESRSRSVSPRSHPSKSRSRSRSTSSKRNPSHTLSRTHDSIRHSRKLSLNLPEKRRSRDRDQIHYDLTSHRRNRSGSVQGRSVDFDRPRESPFSNGHALTPSARSSISVSTTMTDIPPLMLSKPPTSALGGILGVVVQVSDRLSVATAASRRGRSASEASMSSVGFGDFYDAYNRQSVLAQRASGASLMVSGGNAAGELMGVGVALPGTGHSGETGRLPRGRPPPLKLGGSGLSEVMEVASPVPSPMVRGMENFPSRI